MTLLLSTKEAADYLGTGLEFVLKRIDAGDIPYLKVGRFIKIHREGLEQWARDAAAARSAFTS